MPTKDTGWAHAAGLRTGHYLDEGDPVCGDSSRTMYGEIDLRPDPPATACVACAHIVRSAGGAPPHQHRWLSAAFGKDRKYVCRCGAKK